MIISYLKKYLLLIISILFSIQILNVNTTSETSWQEFNRKILQSKEVEKIVVVNGDIAQIYIKKEFLKRDKYRDVSKKSFGNGVNEGPHYFFQISSPNNLEEKLKEAQKDFQEEDRVEIKYTTKKKMLLAHLHSFCSYQLFSQEYFFH